MPLRCTQLFVRTDSLDALGDALGRALQKQRRPKAGEERRLLAVLCGGWATVVLEATEYPAAAALAAPLAQALSERLPEPVLLLALDGGGLLLEVQTFDRGDPGPVEADPAPPHFRDVEAAAWELLSYLGVPAALRLLPLRSIETVASSAEGGLPALAARLGSEQIELWTVQAIPPERAEAAVPIEPDVVVESAAGEARAIEVRRLQWLEPSLPAAEALVAVEEAQARRIVRRLAAETEEERIPRPTFTYQSRRVKLLESMLVHARARRPWLARVLSQPPLSRAGFTARCREALERGLPGARVARAHALRLELESGHRAPLGEAWEAYLETLDEDAPVAAVVAALRARLEAPPVAVLERPREEVLAALLPTLFAGEPAGRAFAEVTPALRAGLLVDDGERIAPLLESELGDLPLAEAFARAVANVEALTLERPEGFEWFDLEHGRVAVADFDDPAGAGRLLAAGARAMLLQILGGTCIAAAPTRDSLLACEDEPDAVAWLRVEAQRRFEEGPFPIDPGLVRVSAGGVWAFGDEAAGAPDEAEPAAEEVSFSMEDEDP